MVAIKEVIQQLNQKSDHQQKRTEATLILAWKAIVSEAICRRTKNIFYKKSKLFIQISSAPLRQELQHNKPKIYLQLKSYAHEYTLSDIIFL